MIVPNASTVETASGRYIDLSDPDPSLFVLEDIARALSRTCRYGGHTRRFFSVAEHARLVSWRLLEQGCPADVALAGLHHDDAEAYIGDITRPVVTMLPDGAKQELEERVLSAIAEGLGLDFSLFSDPRVKAADDWALACEAHRLMPSRGQGWHCDGLYDPQDGFPFTLGSEPERAEEGFLTAHRVLTGQLT